MNQVISSLPLPIQSTEKILCYYVNVTDKMQRIRVTNSLEFDQERVIFPKQRLLFEATPIAWLEIYGNTLNGMGLGDRISCNHLRVLESNLGTPREFLSACEAIAS